MCWHTVFSVVKRQWRWRQLTKEIRFGVRYFFRCVRGFVCHKHCEEGVTLIELLAAMTITVMIGGVLVSVLWPTMMRALRMMTYNSAQRQVVFINQALVREFHTADFVQVQSGVTSSGEQRIVLWLYKGSPQNAYLNNTINPSASSQWLYNTTTVLTQPATNNTTNLAIVSPNGAFGAFVFTQQSSSSWTVQYTTNGVGMGTTGACSSTNFQALTNNPDFTRSGLNVQFDFPNLTTLPNCVFVNSFIVRLTSNYESSTGQSERYTLTAGYHDRDRR